MKVVTVDSKDGESWDAFVRSAPDATSYHQFGWYTVITKSFGHRCQYLAVLDNKKEWQGVLPLVHMKNMSFSNLLVSVPFVNYGGLLCKSDAATSLLLVEAEQLRHDFGATYVELRHLAHGLEGLPTRQHKVTMILDLANNIDCQWRIFNAKLRNQIRKAEKNDLRSVVGHLELLDGFYEVLARNMRDLGTPVFAKSFFRNILETFSDTTKIFAVYHKNRMIAAGIAFWFKNTLEIPWASSISDYKLLCPNNMLYWEAIQFAIERGFNKLDFGRSTPHEGTYNFKKQWGALPIQLHWQYLTDKENRMPDLSPTNPRYKSVIQAWQRLPVSVTKVIGPIIRKHISL